MKTLIILVHTNTHIMKLHYLAAKQKDKKTGKQIK